MREPSRAGSVGGRRGGHEAREGAEGERDEGQGRETGGEDAAERVDDQVTGDAEDVGWVPEAQALRCGHRGGGVAVQRGGSVGAGCDALALLEQDEGARCADEHQQAPDAHNGAGALAPRALEAAGPGQQWEGEDTGRGEDGPEAEDVEVYDWGGGWEGDGEDEDGVEGGGGGVGEGEGKGAFDEWRRSWVDDGED